jgi:phage terminase large subunit GpA-like protein
LVNLADGSAIYRKVYLEGLEPDPAQTVDEWSDRYRILSGKGAAEPGPYRTSRTPYLKEIMQCLSPNSPIQRIVFMKSAQVGASEAGFNWLGYIMHSCPGPTMMVQPTTELAEKVSKQRIQSMIEETPVLSEIVDPEKSRSSGNSILLKNFRGGVLSIVGANSPVGLRSMPVRFLFCDEVDAYPKDVGGTENREGDPLTLAIKRTKTFQRRKIFLVSTPTVKDSSRIEHEYVNSDQRRYFVPCPHCGAMQWLQWKQMKWQDRDPTTVKYECEHCHELITERYKTQMLSDGQWIATDPGPGKSAGFHISALYSPAGLGDSWVEIVDEFLKAQKDAPLLKAWVNTVLGESWEEEYSAKVGSDHLRSRVEVWEPDTAPAGVVVAVAGVDVQDNRFAVTIDGYGEGEESWTLSHFEVYGDPARPEMWKQLEEILLRTIKHETHEPIKITAACIDSGGHFAHEVYQFTRSNRHRLWLAIKGASQKGKPVIGKASKVDVNFKGQVLKSGAEVYIVGTDTAKSTIYGRLKHNQPGPGFQHFHSQMPHDYFEQLTAEKLVPRYVKGFVVREWQKKSGARNEALDCKVYSYAALRFVLNHYDPKTVWQTLAKKLVPKIKTEEKKTETGQDSQRQAKLSPKRRNFLTSW